MRRIESVAGLRWQVMTLTTLLSCMRYDTRLATQPSYSNADICSCSSSALSLMDQSHLLNNPRRLSNLVADVYQTSKQLLSTEEADVLRRSFVER